MDMVSEQVIDSVQEKLAPRIEREYGLNRHVLLYDTTDFFAFLATSNSRGSMAKRGHSKAKRHHLRQVRLALLVTQAGQVPLFHRVYTGNITDVTLFSELAKELLGRKGRALVVGVARLAALGAFVTTVRLGGLRGFTISLQGRLHEFLRNRATSASISAIRFSRRSMITNSSRLVAL